MTVPQIRAIVVEDDLSWQQILKEILADEGLWVDTASTLEEAQSLMKGSAHRLAIVDLSLESHDHHNEDGLRVLESVKQLDPGCQCILLTGFATVELAVSVLTTYGAFSFLRKESFNRAQFRELIRQALASAPLAEKSTDVAKVSKPDANQPSETSINAGNDKILVVEDDAGWRNILAEILEDSGHYVRVCTSYGDALSAMQREKFILAVVDLSLSGDPGRISQGAAQTLEGYPLLAAAREAGILTIVVSGASSVEEIKRTYEEQAVFAFLEKQTFARASFARLVQEAMASRRKDSELAGLTQREQEVYDLLIRGMMNKDIAETLTITNNTVKRHLKAIFEKLGVHTRSELIAKRKG